MTNRLISRTVTPEQQELIRTKITARIAVDANGCWITQPSRTGLPKRGPSNMKLFGWCLTVPVWACLGWKSDTIPPGTAVCHICDVPRCANPDHLWIGDDSENAKDAYHKGRRKSPFVGHGPRSKDIELALGRRRILMRWHGDAWPTEYERRYGKIPAYLEAKLGRPPHAA
jgi:hypothetical protein